LKLLRLMKRLLQSEEWSQLRIGPGLELESYEDLLDILSAWKQYTNEDPGNYFEIKPSVLIPKFWSGTLTASNLVLEISPIGSNSLNTKSRSILDSNVSAMLSIANTTLSRDAGLALLSTEGPRYHALVHSFCVNLRAARRRRIIRSYVAASDSMPYPKGRIVYPSQSLIDIRQPGRFSCQWVALSQDTPENRIFKEVLLRYRPRCSGITRNLIDTCLSELDEVTTSGNYTLELSRLRKDRLSEDYVSLLDQSIALLNNEGVGLFAGGSLATSEVVFTSRLFERYVAREIALTAPTFGLFAKSQHGGTFVCSDGDGKGAFELIPDVRVLDANGSTALIVDAKWKRLHDQGRNYGISRSDIYQILMYASRFRCAEVALVYPDVTIKTGSTGSRRELYAQLGTSTYTVHIITIPLFFEGCSLA
jgi:5-methylcytosine-specific restriction endonuclease McrBC regulatory subunit McrC